MHMKTSRLPNLSIIHSRAISPLGAAACGCMLMCACMANFTPREAF